MTTPQFITDLKTIFNDASIPDATLTLLTDSVIDELNLNGCNITLTASSSDSLSSSQKGGVRKIFRCMYASWYKNAANKPSSGVGGIALTNMDLMSDPVVLNMVKDVASNLRNVEPPIYVGNSPVEF